MNNMYTLCLLFNIYGDTYYTIGYEDRYITTHLNKASIESNLRILDSMGFTLADTGDDFSTTKVATFTTYEDLITNYPELLI